MKTTQAPHLLTFLLACLFIGHANAAVLVNYTIPDNSATRTTPTSTATGASATNITANNLGTFSFVRYNSSTDAALTAAPSVTQTTLSVTQTLADATYFEFTITPNSGQAMSLTSLTFQAAAGGSSSPRGFYVASSIGGFSSSNILLSDSNDSSSGGTLPIFSTTGNFKSYTIDLSQLVGATDITTAVTFRFYVQSPGTTSSINFDNITLNGVMSTVPEPSTACLLTAGCLSLAVACYWRRMSDRQAR